MSILTLPNEILLKILKNCNVTDICQIELTCSSFNTHAKDQSLWQSFCQRAFPKLEFKNVGKDFKYIYRHEVCKYTKLLGIWIKVGESRPIMNITTNDSQLYGFYFSVSTEVFGDRPLADLHHTLRVEWYPQFQTWGTPLSTSTRRGLQFLPADLTVDQDNELQIKYEEMGEYRKKVITIIRFEKISVFLPVLQLLHFQQILPQGLFVECISNTNWMIGNPTNICYIVKATYSYSQDSKHIMIDTVADPNHTIIPGAERVRVTTSVTLSEVKRISMNTANSQPLPDNISYVDDLGSLDLRDKLLPGKFIQEFFGIFDIIKLTSTYRVAFECVMERLCPTIYPTLPGFCLIFNDNIFCVFNYKFGTFRLYYRLEPILSEELIKTFNTEAGLP